MDEKEKDEKEEIQYGKFTIPSYCSPHSRGLINKGDENCKHEWIKSETDIDVYFTCRKCKKKWGYEVYD